MGHGSVLGVGSSSAAAKATRRPRATSRSRSSRLRTGRLFETPEPGSHPEPGSNRATVKVVRVPVIEAIDLRRTYQTTTGVIRRKRLDVEAVRGISFSVEKGELFGLLGPNGAGKTTTIKMLITLLLPTSGEARVLGHNVVDNPREVRKRIGYVFGGDRGLYERLSAYDNLRYFAELYGVSGSKQRRRIDEVLELVGLKGREN